MSIVLRSLFYNVFVSNVLKSYIAFSNNVTCVVPENIDNPPPNRRDWKFQVVGGCLNEFFQTGLNFHTVVCMATFLLMMCQSHYPTIFWGKKTGKDQNLVSCTQIL